VTVLESMEAGGHEQVLFWSEPEFGVRGIIAIHDTTLGPALGGTRFRHYASEAEALADVLRLAEGMTYKAAVAGLNLGGGKSVLIGDPRASDREMIFRAHGRAVEALGGRYITAEDVGTSVDDMEFVRMETSWVTGVHGGSGDPSPLTALGVFEAIRATLTRIFGTPELRGRRVLVQGLGHVGTHLCELLGNAGVHLTVADLDPDRCVPIQAAWGAQVVSPQEIHRVPADLFAPCALGAVLNDASIPELQVRGVAGAANNQLAESRHADALRARNILYAPDYVVNAGGLINVYGELHGWDRERSRRKAGEIHGSLLRVFDIADREGCSTAAAADRLAQERIRQIRHLHRSHA
jgi:leucine dehydrogenase